MAGRSVSERQRNRDADEEIIMEEDSPPDVSTRNRKRNTKKTKVSKQDMLNYQLIKDCGIDSSDMSKQEMDDLAKVLLLSKADTNKSKKSSPASRQDPDLSSSPFSRKSPTPVHTLEVSDEETGQSSRPYHRKSPAPTHTLEVSDEETDLSSHPYRRKSPAPTHALEVSDEETGLSSHPCCRKSPAPTHALEVSDEENGLSSHPYRRKSPAPTHALEVSDEETGLSSHPYRRKSPAPTHALEVSDEETGLSSRPYRRKSPAPTHTPVVSDEETGQSSSTYRGKVPTPVHTPEASDEEYMEVNDQETQIGETKYISQYPTDSIQYFVDSDRKNKDVKQCSNDSPQCIADSDEETQLVDYEKPSFKHSVEEVNQFEESTEKNAEIDRVNSASDEETQYVITESTLRDDVLTTDSNIRDKKKKSTTKHSNSTFSTKKFTQRKIEQYSHVVIPDSPPKSPSQSSQDSSPVKCRRSVKRPIVESDDEDTQDYYERKEGVQNLAEDCQQAAKRYKVDNTENDVSDMECENEGSKPPALDREDRKSKQTKLTLHHPAQFILVTGILIIMLGLYALDLQVEKDRERANSPAAPIKPLCRHYRKTKKKGSQMKALYSPSVDSVSTYTKAIIQYFEIYHRRLTQLQAKSKYMIEWGQSVKVGKHWETTIDAKRRGQEAFDVEISDEEKENAQRDKDDKNQRAKTDKNSKNLMATIQIDEDDDFDSYVPLRQTRRNKARVRDPDHSAENEKNEEIAQFLNTRSKSGKRMAHAISLSDSEDDSHGKSRKLGNASEQVSRNKRNDDVVLDGGNKLKSCHDDIPSLLQDGEKSRLSNSKLSDSVQIMNYSTSDRKTQNSGKYSFRKTSERIGEEKKHQKESSPDLVVSSKPDNGIGEGKKCKVVLKRYKSDLSTKSTGSVRSDDLDLECLDEDSTSVSNKQGIHTNEESMDKFSQSSSALLNSQGDLYSTQYCVRKQRAAKVASVQPVIRSSSPEITGDEDTCSGSQEEGKQTDQSNNHISEGIQSDLGSSADGWIQNFEPRDGSDNLTDNRKSSSEVDYEKNNSDDSSSESDKGTIKGLGRKKFTPERKFHQRNPHASNVKEMMKNSSSDEETYKSVQKSGNKGQEPSLNFQMDNRNDLISSQGATLSTSKSSKLPNTGKSELYSSRSPSPDQQFHIVNPKAGSSKSEVVDVEIDSSTSEDEIVVRRGSRKRVKTYTKNGRNQQVSDKVKVQEEEKVPCPMCFKQFSVAKIQEHAENCEGETGSTEEDSSGIQEHSTAKRGTAREEDISDIQEQSTAKGQTARENVNLVAAGGGDNRNNSTNMSTPNPRGTQKCYICDKRFAKGKYDAHVDLCLKEATKRQEMADTKGYDQVLNVDDEPELEPVVPRQTRLRAGDRRNQSERQQSRNQAENKQLNFDGYYTDSDDTLPVKNIVTKKKPTFSWNLPSDNNEESEECSSSSSYNLVYYSSSSNSPTKTPIKSSHNTLPGGWTAEELDNSPIRTFIPIWQQKDSEGFSGQFDNLKKKYERQLVKKKLSGKRISGRRRKTGRRKKRKVQSRKKNGV